MESSSQDLFLLLRNVLTQLPSLLTLLLCLTIALVRWKRHPKVSLVAAVGFISIILHGLFFSAAYIWLPRVFTTGSYEENTSFYSLLGLLRNILFAVIFAVLLSAIFIERKQKLA